MKTNHYATKEIILDSAKDIASQQGIHKVNIRTVAQMSGIAIGTVYNYYPSKADLLVAIIEDFWANAFKKINVEALDNKDLYEKLEVIYSNLSTYLQKYKTNWLHQISLLDIEDKKLGRKKEKEYFRKIHVMVLSLLNKDESLSHRSWKEEMTKDMLAEFIVDNMIIMLKKEESDIGFFILILKKILSA